MWLIGHPGLKAQVNIAGDKGHAVRLRFKDASSVLGLVSKMPNVFVNRAGEPKKIMLNSMHVTVQTVLNISFVALRKPPFTLIA